jgi:hypothetical protein
LPRSPGTVPQADGLRLENHNETQEYFFGEPGTFSPCFPRSIRRASFSARHLESDPKKANLTLLNPKKGNSWRFDVNEEYKAFQSASPGRLAFAAA